MAGFGSGARFTSKLLEQKMTAALRVASEGRLADEIQEDLSEIADGVAGAIRASGRASQHPDFANFTARVTTSGAGRLNARIGWLNYPGDAREKGSGGKLWYQYQNWGYNAFGRGTMVSGLGFLDGIDEKVTASIQRSIDRYLGNIERALQ